MSSSQRFPIIGLRGFIASGKTTTANRITNLINSSLGQTVTFNHSFADPLKAVMRMLGVSKEKNPSLYRDLLTYIGARIRRDDPDFFVKEMQKTFDLFYDNNRDDGAPLAVVIDDVRYPNEATICTHLFYLHRIQHPDWTPFDPSKLEHLHESERFNAPLSPSFDVQQIDYSPLTLTIEMGEGPKQIDEAARGIIRLVLPHLPPITDLLDFDPAPAL